MDKTIPIIVKNYQEAAEICRTCDQAEEHEILVIRCKICGCGIEARTHCIIYKWQLEEQS